MQLRFIFAAAKEFYRVPDHSPLMTVLRLQHASAVPLQVISLPVPLRSKLKYILRKRAKKEQEQIQIASRRGNTNIPIITGKRKEINHFKGQVYGRFQSIPLASQGWTHRKSSGDYFVLHAHEGNPATHYTQDNSENRPKSFSGYGLSPEILNGLEELNLKTPTNIQDLAIPQLQKQNHAVVAAETGSGKTVAYLVPIIEKIIEAKRLTEETHFNSPSALILVPGRELADQIGYVARRLCKSAALKVKTLTGGRGVGIKTLLNPPAHEVDIMVATLGALKRLVHGKVYSVKKVKHLVIDEADTMLDDSFNESVLQFLNRFSFMPTAPKEMWTHLFLVGATLPRDLSTILDAVIDVDSMTKITTTHLHRIMPHVPQKFLRLKSSEKTAKLLEVVKDDMKKGKAVMIFSKNRATSDYVSIILQENDIPNIALNGQLSGKYRKGLFRRFMEGEVNVISCTDIGSRGLDTGRVQHVINYDFPSFMSDYIHRIGRTGRVGGCASGHVTNFVSKVYEVQLVQKIETAARKLESLPNVNANIKRKLLGRQYSEEYL